MLYKKAQKWIIVCWLSNNEGCSLLWVKWPQKEKYSCLFLGNGGLNCTGPLTHRFFSPEIQYGSINVFSLPHDFLGTSFSSLGSFTRRLQCAMHVAYKVDTNWLFMLLGRLPSNSRLLGFWGVYTYIRFLIAQRVRTPAPTMDCSRVNSTYKIVT